MNMIGINWRSLSMARKPCTYLTVAMLMMSGLTGCRAENVSRLIEVDDTKGNVLRLITNRFDLSADKISDIYRSHWAIELFFKWLKQHVEIKYFYDMIENALQNKSISH